MSEPRADYHFSPMPASAEHVLPADWYGVDVYIALDQIEGRTWRGQILWTNAVGLLLHTKQASKGEVFLPWGAIREVART